MSTTIGISFINVPHAFYYLGAPISIFLSIGIGALNYYATHLYLATKNNLPGQILSLYEMGFMIHGRKSIFFISLTILLFFFGLMQTYFILFGEICCVMYAEYLKFTNDNSD